MKAKHILFLYRMNLSVIQRILLFIAETLLLMASLTALFVLIYRFGFEQTEWYHPLKGTYKYILFAFFVGITLRYFVKFKDIIQEKMLYLDLSIYLILFAVLSRQWLFKDVMTSSLPFLDFLANPIFDYVLMLSLSIIHISRLIFSTMQAHIRPSLLFSVSFLIVILLGTGMLMLPNATFKGIDFIDALFMATTSVCVTGLTTVDPATTFTHTGYIIIMLLIQIGGIGVMTFTSFFALSFMGKSSFNSQMLLKDFLNEDRLNGLFKVVISIIFVTFVVEVIGAYLIYIQIDGTLHQSTSQDIFFSIFHSISAFCNAGISTMGDNLGDPLVSHNYSFQFWIAILIIIGGIGFPIVFNYMKLIHHLIVNGVNMLIGRQKHYIHLPHIINVYTYIVILSTFVLLTLGTVVYFYAENDNILAGLPFTGKLTGAFFASATSRTAGFSTVNMDALTNTSMLLLLVLMAIGASPMSTGGGMKTTTVFVALLSMWNVSRNKTPMEVFGREIMPNNIRKAFTIILLYLVWMSIAIFLLSHSEKDVHLFTLFFEVASALSTVGLSLDFTPHLSLFGKCVIILTMFIGRISVLMFFGGFFKEWQPRNYAYPQENILM